MFDCQVLQYKDIAEKKERELEAVILSQSDRIQALKEEVSVRGFIGGICMFVILLLIYELLSNVLHNHLTDLRQSPSCLDNMSLSLPACLLLTNSLVSILFS